MNLKKLPIGIQTFNELRTKDYLYIDKTKEAYELIESGTKFYFLSRPRRFGKSLFLDTLQDIFEAKKELFEDLYIYDKYNWEEKYPVIKIDFFGDLRSPQSLKKVILSTLRSNQKRLNVQCDDINDFGVCFKELIENIYFTYNQQVVVLIDEYDKAILDNLDQMEVAQENREIIKSFYTVLKGCERYIKFCFLTGVSKFSRASIFSGLNMLKDISLDKRYGNICGYTQDDIETTILPYLNGVDLSKLKNWYNGYNFLKDDMYNPFDILLFIDNDFLYSNYWFSSGTPTFLIKLIKNNNYFLPKLANLTIGEELLDGFDIDNIELEVILYQAGYLTIDKVFIDEDEDIQYSLKLPNREVKSSLNKFIITNLYKDTSLNKKGLSRALREENLELFKSTLVSIFSSIPYNNYIKNNIANYEGFYASVIYVYLQSLGINIIGEDITNKGRIDLTIIMEEAIYILEFKVGNKDALAQIKEKNYVQKYLDRNKDIYLIGINFDEKEHNLTHTPIIALTANALKGDRERFLEAGMDEYMTKPLDRSKLSEVLKQFLV